MAGIGLEVRALARKNMGSEVSTSTIGVHAHFLPDFYRDATAGGWSFAAPQR